MRRQCNYRLNRLNAYNYEYARVRGNHGNSQKGEYYERINIGKIPGL